MAKRFIDTNVFKKGQLRRLESKYKLLWLYLSCECDHAGLWDSVDLDVAGIRLGESYDHDEAIKALEGRVLVYGDKWFVCGFIDFQYGELNPRNRVHASVINRIRAHGIDLEDLDAEDAFEILGSPPIKRDEPESAQPEKTPSGDEWDGVLPKKASSLSKSKQKQRKCLKSHPQLERLGRLFGRRASTLPTISEALSFRNIKAPLDEVDLIVKYYADSKFEYLRTSLETLLNNWSGELDKARQWKASLSEREQSQQKKPRSIWELNQQLKRCQVELDELRFPGGCAHPVALEGEKLNRANDLIRRIKRLKKEIADHE